MKAILLFAVQTVLMVASAIVGFFRRLFAPVNKAVMALVVAVASMLSMPMAHAAAPDFTTLTSGIDFSTAITAVLAGFLLLAGLGLAIMGGRVVLRALGLLPR